MFAGLPGIGVGTLFYIVMALCMPVIEIRHLVRGTSSFARWQQIIKQWCFSAAIILSIMVAERVLMVIFTGGGPRSLSPARLLNQELSAHAPQSILAAPMTASLVLVAAVLLFVEIMRLIQNVRRSTETQPGLIGTRQLRAARGTHALPEPIEPTELVAD
jgi:hypothetical protein